MLGKRKDQGEEQVVVGGGLGSLGNPHLGWVREERNMGGKDEWEGRNWVWVRHCSPVVRVEGGREGGVHRAPPGSPRAQSTAGQPSATRPRLQPNPAPAPGVTTSESRGGPGTQAMPVSLTTQIFHAGNRPTE